MPLLQQQQPHLAQRSRSGTGFPASPAGRTSTNSSEKSATSARPRSDIGSATTAVSSRPSVNSRIRRGVTVSRRFRSSPGKSRDNSPMIAGSR
jgi:hypothetical protein